MKHKNKNIYIIAEIGLNHDGKIKKAIKLTKLAKKAGANAAKFQIFDPSSLSAINSKNYKFWESVSFSYQQFRILKKICKKYHIDFIASVFDEQSLRIAKKLKLKTYKIASGELTNTLLLKKISKTKKKIILSTGMASLKEIKHALKIFSRNQVELLHCVSLYPCETKFANLNRIATLKKKFRKDIGYSDHARGIDACKIAITKGCKIIEKHFTNNKKLAYGDHKLSADFEELKNLVNFAKNYKLYLGSGKINPSFEEKKYIKLFRKGVYAANIIKKNSKIFLENLKIRRPETKLKINEIKNIIRKKAKKKILIDQEILKKNITS